MNYMEKDKFDDVLLESIPDDQKKAMLKAICRIIKLEQLESLKVMEDFTSKTADNCRFATNVFANKIINLFSDLYEMIDGVEENEI